MIPYKSDSCNIFYEMIIFLPTFTDAKFHILNPSGVGLGIIRGMCVNIMLAGDTAAMLFTKYQRRVAVFFEGDIQDYE